MDDDLILAATNAQIAERNEHFSTAKAFVKLISNKKLEPYMVDILEAWINRIEEKINQQ
jgi:hypothetical protein